MASINLKNSFISLPLTFFAWATTSFSQAQSELHHTMEVLLSEQQLTGAVWATISESGEIRTGATGYKNASSRTLLSPTDKVHVGSVSKTVLAAGFLRLATQGLIDLDDPVKQYLPALPLDNPWAESNPVTIRHLLDHTSGLTDARLWHVFSTTATPDTPLEYAYTNDPSILKIHAKPGSIYSYSNLGYTILGMMIEKLTQGRYEQYLDKNLLKPLGMLHSTFEFVSQEGIHADEELASGHLDDGQPVSGIPGYLRPAGQFTTTAEDMGIFLRFLMSDGTINGTPFIKADYLKSIGIQRKTEAFVNGVPYGDALGAYSRDRYGVIGLAKNGNILGFSSMIYLFPEHKRAFFISHNMDSETADYDLFNQALVRHLDIPAKQFITTQRATEDSLQSWNGYYIPVITKVEPFALFDKVFSHTKVTVIESGALIEPSQGKKRELIYQGKNLFSMQDRTNISHAFYKNENGDFLVTDGIRTVKKISGWKIVGLATILLLGVIGIVHVIVSSIVRLFTLKSNRLYHPNFLILISLMILLIGIVLIINQSFIRLGDRTLGNIVLAVGSLLLPMHSLIALIQLIRAKKKFRGILDLLAVIFIVQVSFLLAANKLMPIIMWR
jgi:CubicO group peptidase (beta-lactamase class C family)